MKIGIMQPYFIPYIGYWQLMNAVDKYVIYDDVHYINRGWVNRNRILVNGRAKYFIIPIKGASQNKIINEIEIDVDSKIISKNLRTIEYVYKKAPYFQEAFPIIEKILNYKESRLVSYIEFSFYVICNYLDIQTEFIISSSLSKDCNLRGEKKILNICKLLQATEYYNSVGGKQLYSFKDFENMGITLKFLQTNKIMYKQFNNEFQPNLSILDVMMFNSRKDIKGFLNQYSLL